VEEGMSSPGILELMARCTVPSIKLAKARYPLFKENVEYS
jgi:hypothetical protein